MVESKEPAASSKQTPNIKPAFAKASARQARKARRKVWWLELVTSLEFGDWDLELIAWSRRCRLRIKLRRARKAPPTLANRCNAFNFLTWRRRSFPRPRPNRDRLRRRGRFARRRWPCRLRRPQQRNVSPNRTGH